MAIRVSVTEPLTYQDAVEAAFAHPEFMEEWRRLSGSTLGLDTRSPILRLVDEATGHDPDAEQWVEFFNFVFKYVWLPMLLEQVEEGTDG